MMQIILDGGPRCEDTTAFRCKTRETRASSEFFEGGCVSQQTSPTNFSTAVCRYLGPCTTSGGRDSWLARASGEIVFTAAAATRAPASLSFFLVRRPILKISFYGGPGYTRSSGLRCSLAGPVARLD